MNRAIDTKIIAGNDVGISGTTIYARKGVTNGDNIAIGDNYKIFDNGFYLAEVETRFQLLQDLYGGDSDLGPAKKNSYR